MGRYIVMKRKGGRDMDFSSRKPMRLADYDYSTNGAYFITICTYRRQKLFGEVGEDSVAVSMIEDTLAEIVPRFGNVECPKFVVMPNHFHGIFVLDTVSPEKRKCAAKLPDVVRSFKSITTNRYIQLVRAGKLPPFQKRIWHRSFYDRIIRNEQEYNEIWAYIDDNPRRWKEDRYYTE